MTRWLLCLCAAGCVGESGGASPADARGADAATGDADPGRAVAVAGADRAVLGGLVVPLDSAGSQGTSFQWTSDEGLPIEGAGDAVAWAHLPDAAPGTAYTFRLTVGAASGEAEDAVTVTLLEAVFEDFLAGVTDPAELNTSEGIDFLGDAMWVVSNGTPFVSRFDPSGAFVEKHAVADNPVGMNLYPDGRLAIANSSLGRVDLLDPASGDLAPLFTELAGGAPVGAANYPLPDAAGNLFLSTRTTLTVVRFDAALGEARVWLDLDGVAVNPNSLAFGPEPDRLYVGTSNAVYRVPILPDGSAGTPAIYLEGAPSEVDGLVFDEGRNLWIGCPNTEELLVAPYVADGPTAVSRRWSMVGANHSRFVNTTFGSAPFGDTTLYWTGLGDRTVGRLPVGLRALDPPLAP